MPNKTIHELCIPFNDDLHIYPQKVNWSGWYSAYYSDKICYAIINDDEESDQYGQVITLTTDYDKALRIQDFLDTIKGWHYTKIEAYEDGFVADQYAWEITWDIRKKQPDTYLKFKPDIRALNQVSFDGYQYQVLVQAYSKKSAIAIGEDLIEFYKRKS